MKSCQPFILSDLAIQLGLFIHAPGLWLQENGNISTLSCLTELYHYIIRFTFTVSQIHTQLTEPLTHCQSQRVRHCCQLVCSPKSSLRWSLKRKKSSITPSWSTGLAECATRMSSWFNRDWPVVRQLTQQHAERSLAFNTCDKAGQVDSCKHTNVFE